jgi:protoporphyrinogen oxidase
MNMNEKIVVVGAGIAGILAAKLEIDKGNDVVLLDASDRAGGLLRSDCIEGNYFDYGIHLVSETGIDALDRILLGELTDKDYSIKRLLLAGNYFNGSFNEKSCFVDTTTLPKVVYNQGCYDVLSAGHNESSNLEEWYTNRYGKTFSQKIFCPVIKKYLGVSAKELSSSVGCFFDLSRLLAFDQRTTEKLGEIGQYYAVLGHHVRKEGVTKFYPKNGGMSTFVDHMLTKLNRNKVHFLLGSQITRVVQNNGVVHELVINGEGFSVDRVIWTIPVSLLAMYVPLGLDVQKPRFRKTLLFDFVFDKLLLSDVSYINVYDLNMNSGRITLYQNLAGDIDGKGRCTVEVLSEKLLSEDDILKELMVIGLVANNAICLFKYKRDVFNGFPVLDLKYVEQSKLQADFYRNYFKNVDFLGKASERAFFMRDVLKEVYSKLVLGV